MLSNRLYYHLKPYLPWRLRMAARRILARRVRKVHRKTWPINEAAARPPEGWPGWPGGKKSALVLTHDVEGPAGLAKCRQLLQLEKELGFRSAFNFIPEGEYAVPSELREELVQNGFEVGVHDLHHDGRLFWTRKEFSGNARWINYYLKKWNAAGFRAGFMLRNLDWLHELDIKYDASTFDTDPFEPQPDGVNTIFPFWVPCPKWAIGNQQLEAQSAIPPSDGGYVELPYTLPQDSTLFLLLREASPAIWLKKLDWITARGGMILVNIHPDYLRFSDEPPSPRTYPMHFYTEVLKHLRNQLDGCYWNALPREMAAFISAVYRPDNLLNGERRDFGRYIPGLFQEASAGVSACTVACTDSSGERAPSKDSRLGLAGSSRIDRIPATERKRLAGKRVAVVLFSYYPSDPRPRRAAEALALEGAEVDFLCLRRDQAEPRRERYRELNIFRVPLKRRRGNKGAYLLQYSAFILAALVFLARRSRGRRYDLIHVHNMPDILVFSALVPKLLGAKLILDLHDPMPELMETIFDLPEHSLPVRFLKWCEKTSIRFADLVLTPNLAFKKLFVSRSCPPGKIHIVVNTPNEEIFRFKSEASVARTEDPSKSLEILYHGSLVYRHGLDLAVDALEIVRKAIPNAELVICGENTPYFERVMYSVRERGLQDAVRYLGMRNRRQIAEAIEQCDVGIIPNRRNVFTEINMPTRIFEYLAIGKPVVTPRTQGIRDYFGEQDLVFFEPGNTADMARQLEFVAFCPEEAKAVVERGQVVYRRHCWSQEKLRFTDLVCGLLSLGSSRIDVPKEIVLNDK